jgi:N-acetylglucosamine kinase-like BadF-type ATPase
MEAATVAQLLEEYSRGGERESNAAPVVLRHAERGDQVAIEIVEWAGAQLGEAARVVASKLAMDGEPFELVMSGGLFHGRSERLEQRIASEVPTALLTRLEAPPVVGAVLMALEQRGSRPTSELHDRIGRSLVTAFR